MQLQDLYCRCVDADSSSNGPWAIQHKAAICLERCQPGDGLQLDCAADWRAPAYGEQNISDV